MSTTALQGIFVLDLRPECLSANKPNGDDVQTDLDLRFDYMYVYTCTQAGFLIIVSLSAFILIPQIVYRIIIISLST